MRYEFETTGPITVAARMRSSDLAVIVTEMAGPAVVDVHPHKGGDDVVAATRVEMVGDRLEIVVPKTSGSLFRVSGSVRVRVSVPPGSSLEVETGSGDIRTEGALARIEGRSGSGDVVAEHAEDVRLTSGSGDVTFERVGTIRATAGSGDLRIGDAAARAELRTGSGDISIARAADMTVVTGSGDVVVEASSGNLSLAAGSGDLTVRQAEEGEIHAKTASGDVLVGVMSGTAALLDCSSVSGHVTTGLSSGDAPSDDEKGVVLRLRAVSGDIRVERA